MGGTSSTCQTDCLECHDIADSCDACFNANTPTGCDPTRAPDNCQSCWRLKQGCHDCFEGGCCTSQKVEGFRGVQGLNKTKDILPSWLIVLFLIMTIYLLIRNRKI